MTTPKKQTEVNITAQELRNICDQFKVNDNDDDTTYAIKKAMEKLEKSDFIIYCLYLELGTKTDVGKILGISRVSASRIIKQIESHIKELINYDLH